MEISTVAIFIFACLVLVGHALRAPLIVALFGSLAFTSTAVATLPALGGASVLLSAPLSGLLVLSVARRKDLWRSLAQVLSLHWTPTIAALLLVYVVAGA